ncbi:sensor histidine kinase [Catenovulum agarivorans]|uniref:sensor histidine kinase n=1 Tax=Catenovulum agarivorans TaxID=1172192 RepID=UPI0002D8B6D7|nr:HAMP domain-containing sensor histidine kinase [Catenovulum agarivorans]
MKDDPKIDFSTVLASAVHDMKNSLCMLIQSIEHLGQSSAQDNPEHADELASLHYEASRLNTNLLQLLSLYRAEKHQLPLTIEENFVSDVVEEMLAKNELYIEKKGLTVELDVAEDLCWFFDLDLIGNLLNDIFINAMRYSKNLIKISAAIKDDQLEITIEDNGNGYPQNMLELIDMPMQELNLTTGRTGLGLFFARMIANAHKNNKKTGRIHLNNGGIYKGSIFKLVLP